jgi:hypothetical protein
MDKISDLISEALSDARPIGTGLDQKLIGLLEPRHRPAAIDISLRIAERRIINELFLGDLQAFYVLLDRLAQEEMKTGWRRHEHDPDCVYPIPIGIDRARIYLGFVDQLVDLGSSIAAALDAAEARLISTRLLEA